MPGFDRVLDGIKAVLLATEEIKRLSTNVSNLSGEVRQIDRRVSWLEGMIVGQAQGAAAAKGVAAPRKRLPKTLD
jgi:hypothetical protein